MVSALLLVGLLAQAPEPPDRIMRAGYVALATVSFQDMYQSGQASQRKTLREGNAVLRPFFKSGTLGLVDGAASGVIGLIGYKLHKADPNKCDVENARRRRNGKIFIWTWTAVRAGVVAWNAQRLREAR